jgi:hypothetical protein
VAGLACAIACLAVVGSASGGPLKVGAADDTGKYAGDCGLAFYGQMNDIGFSVDRVAVLWDETQPATIVEQGFLDRTVPCAAQKGIKLVFDVFPLHPTAISADPLGRSAQFVAWLQKVAQRYPTVTSVIVGNEPNVNRFWQPVASGPAQFEALLALSYDALKTVNPDLTVITSVSSRGNDDCRASDNISTSPYRLIYDMGAAYRAMARTRPAWDEWGIHAYPNKLTDPLTRGFPWPNIGLTNLGRLKQALWDAFSGTAQPTFGAFRSGSALAAVTEPKITIPETGWQAAVPDSSLHAYYGKENVEPTSEQEQADIYTQIIRTVPCDPDVRELLFFGVYDDPDLARMQTGSSVRTERAGRRTSPSSGRWPRRAERAGRAQSHGRLRAA